MFGPAYKGIPLAVSTAIALTSGHGMQVGYTFDRKEKKDHGDGGMMVGTQLADGMKVLLVDDVMTAGTAVREVIPEAQGRGRRRDRRSGVECRPYGEDEGFRPVRGGRGREAEFGFPVLAIANVKEIFEAGRNIVTSDGQPYVTDAIKSAADDYLERYGA